MWKIKNVQALPYVELKVSDKAGLFELTMPASSFGGLHAKLSNPDHRVGWWFVGGEGTQASLSFSAGREFVCIEGALYTRATWNDIGIKHRQNGLKRIKNKQLIWWIKPIPLTDELRAEMSAQISKAVWRTDDQG